MTEQVNSNNENLDREIPQELKDSIGVLSSIIDTGLCQYNIEWQRISTMQQSAGILIAGLTIVVSALVVFLNLDESSFLITNRIYLNQIIFPLVYMGFIFVCLALVFFFRVIWPKNIMALPHPKELYRNLTHEELWKNLATIINKADNSINSIHEHVQNKQIDYLKSLLFLIASIITTGLILLLLLLKVSFLQAILFYYWVTLTLIVIIFITFVFIRIKGI